MTEVVPTQEVGNALNRRRIGHKKGGKAKTKMRNFQGSGGKPKIDKRMQKLFRKRARDYNSDDDEDEEHSPVTGDLNKPSRENHEVIDGKSSDEEEEENRARDEMSEDEEGEIQPGVTKFTEGCNAFRNAFKKIAKKNISDDLLGPVLSAHKKLLAEKLAEEDEERKVKGEAKKEKHLIKEKGHVKPANFLDSHEKFLIGIATKGVVKLFNAVNKAQNAQKGLNPSRSKDAKAIKKRRKEAFFSELGKTSLRSTEARNSGRGSSSGTGDGEGPSWAPLRDSYMLTNPKLKDWDKMQGTNEADESGGMSSDSSGDDD